MRRLTCEISIGKLSYTGVAELEINSSYENLTDTARIVFPRKVKYKDQRIQDLITRGQAVTVKLGYDDENAACFTGFVKTLKADIPIEVECEDAMFLLKANSLTKGYATVSLENLLKDTLAKLPQKIDFEAVGFTFRNLRINHATPAEILDKLKSDFGLPFFFRDGKLYAGLNIWAKNTVMHEIKFQRDVVSNNLTFTQKEDLRLKVVAKSLDGTNKETKVEVGDKDGAERTFYYSNYSEAELTKVANTELEKLKYDGYRGSFTTFGTPNIKHGDAVKLTDTTYPERDGTYLVKSVKKTFGQSGFRQEVELDRLK